MIGEILVKTLYNAMLWPAFADSPLAPWREHVTSTCLEREPERCGHVSCARREVWCAFEAWFQRTVRS